MKRITLILLSAAMLLAGCTPAAEPAKGPAGPTAAELALLEQARALMLPRDTAPADFERNQAACNKLGGSFGQDGMLGAFHCALTYSDADKPCFDKADCKGQCRGKPEPAAAGEAPGLCQRTTSPFGCYSTVRNGRIEGTICVD